MFEVEVTSHSLQFGGRDAIIVVANDVTERQRAERALHEAQGKLQAYADELEKRVTERTASLEASIKSLEGVLYHVAHDLRAPFRAMNGLTRLLAEEYHHEQGGRTRDYAERIMEASRTMDEKIHDLLEFGRLGHQPVCWTIIELKAVPAGIASAVA